MGGELRDPRVLGEDDPEAWEVVLEGGMKGRWRCTHAVYVYDPTHHESGRRGFYPCEVGSLKEGDRVFVMSHDLRDKVEGVLRDAELGDADRTGLDHFGVAGQVASDGAC